MIAYVYHWEAFVFTFGTFNEKNVHIRKGNVTMEE